MKTFEQYLRDIHAKSYIGTDDDMPDAFEAWVSELEASDVMQLAEDCISELIT